MDQKRSPVTRKDIALEAGVSETIVSYVMNNNRYVDKEKRKRVLEAVEKLGYRAAYSTGCACHKYCFFSHLIKLPYFKYSQISRTV